MVSNAIAMPHISHLLRLGTRQAKSSLAAYPASQVSVPHHALWYLTSWLRKAGPRSLQAVKLDANSFKPDATCEDVGEAVTCTKELGRS